MLSFWFEVRVNDRQGRTKKGYWNVEKNGYRERVMGIYQLLNDHLWFHLRP